MLRWVIVFCLRNNAFVKAIAAMAHALKADRPHQCQSGSLCFMPMTHAYAKDVTLLSAGSVIHALSDQNGSSQAQMVDMR